jgi:hypothetical protein
LKIRRIKRKIKFKLGKKIKIMKQNAYQLDFAELIEELQTSEN